MQFQAFNKILIGEQVIRKFAVGEDVLGYQFKIRYPSYRGTFLSCIEKLEFKMDDELIESHNIRFQLNGKEYLVEELKDQYKTYWYILDEATIVVMKEGGLSLGEHNLMVHMQHRIPYAGYGGKYLVLPSTVTKILLAE